GDPSAFMGLYDEELETVEVAKAIEGNATAEEFAAKLSADDIDPFELLWASATPASDGATTQAAPVLSAPTAEPNSLFSDSYRYLRDALRLLMHNAPRDQAPVTADDARRTVTLQPSRDLA